MKEVPAFDHYLDAKGLSCPLPLLKMKQVLNTMAVGEVIYVITTDGGSERDFCSFSEQSSHRILYKDQMGEEGKECEYRFWLKKGG
ncbi:MAG: sulfurtransferase TusA family protein [Pseudomonadales bacterium]|nr:sulfurtransferase TusA family protein [Pseudomonadales bacterium]